MTFLAILPLLLLLLLATCVTWRVQGEWLLPGPLFGVFWFACLVTPLLLAKDFYVEPAAVACIVFLSITFLAGNVLGDRLGTLQLKIVTPAAPTSIPSLAHLRVYLFVGVTLGMVAVLFLLRAKGYSFGVFTSLKAIAEMGREYSISRYQDDFLPPFWARIFMTGAYFSALIGGTLCVIENSRARKLICYLPFLPALLYGAVQTSRATVLFTGILWVSGLLSMTMFFHRGKISLFTIGNLVRITLILCGIIGMFIVFAMFRYNMLEISAIFDIIIRLRVWFFGYLSGFSGWFDVNYLLSNQLTWGQYTFSGIFQYIGSYQRDLGIYSQFVQIDDSAQAINVYTIFRPLLEDFGLFGALFFLAVGGIYCGIACRLTGQGYIRFVPILTISYAITFCSHVTSILSYSTILLALLLYCLVFLHQSRVKTNA
jgi:oligosaccharide repeat unit polymerase